MHISETIITVVALLQVDKAIWRLILSVWFLFYEQWYRFASDARNKTIWNAGMCIYITVDYLYTQNSVNGFWYKGSPHMKK